ncbi:MAG: hypothetical protein J7647_24240 [Cyanobacteria bacterium SBLK]|nr:hypothetical protein [Cyanobacteria bacterium SBLK]
MVISLVMTAIAEEGRHKKQNGSGDGEIVKILMLSCDYRPCSSRSAVAFDCGSIFCPERF